MSAYREMKIDKSLYQRRGGFFRALEEMDPSADYRGTDLEKLTAFERQLKRFDICLLYTSDCHGDPSLLIKVPLLSYGFWGRGTSRGL